jgi:hypothetical protein
MVDDHFSRETLAGFFRSELSKEETRALVRHLLKQCPQCSLLLREVSGRESFQLLFRGVEETVLRSETSDGERPLARVSPFFRRGDRAVP